MAGNGNGHGGAPPTSSPRVVADLGFATINDLVAELVAATDIVAPDRLSAARGRAGIGSLAQALAVEGVATPTGVARALARRFDLPYIDLAEERVSPDAAEQIPLRTLKRVVAIPVNRLVTIHITYEANHMKVPMKANLGPMDFSIQE